MAKTVRLELLSTHNPSAVPLDGQYHLEFIRKRLTADEVYATNARLAGTPPRTQTTPDGGTTWVDDPSVDPRLATGIPRRVGATDSCPAALSVTEYFKRYITLVLSLVSAGATLVQGMGALLAFLNVLGGYGILWEIVQGMFGTLLGYGATAISTAFTTAQYDALASILYCTMNNGQLDAAGLASVKQQVTARLNATAAPIVNLMLDIMGYAGVNRAALFYTIAGGCGAFPSCNWSLCIDLTWLWGLSSPASPPAPGCPPNYPFSPQGALGSYGGHPAWLLQKGLGDTANRIGRRFPIDLPAGSTLTAVQWWLQRSAGNIDQFNKVTWDQSTAPRCVTGAFNNNPQGGAVSEAGAQRVTMYLGVGTTVGSDGSTMAIDQIRIVGTGPRPNVLTVAQIYA